MSTATATRHTSTPHPRPLITVAPMTATDRLHTMTTAANRLGATLAVLGDEALTMARRVNDAALALACDRRGGHQPARDAGTGAIVCVYCGTTLP